MPKQAPCTAKIEPGENGGLTVSLIVPGSEKPLRLQFHAERDNDGDWRVFIPWPDDILEPRWVIQGGYEVINGVMYLASKEN